MLTSNIKYTRDDLNNLYKQEQKEIRRNSIMKIADHLIESIIKKAKQGDTTFVEYFPKNKLCEIQDELVIQMKKVFPDSEITVQEIVVDGINSIAVRIDWDLINV